MINYQKHLKVHFMFGSEPITEVRTATPMRAEVTFHVLLLYRP